MKRVLFGFVFGALLLVSVRAKADSGILIAPGGTLNTYGDVTVGTGCGQVLSTNPNKRIDASVCNTGSNAARCGGSLSALSGASSTQGIPLSASSGGFNGGCAWLPTTSAIYCCAATGSTTISPAEITR